MVKNINMNIKIGNLFTFNAKQKIVLLLTSIVFIVLAFFGLVRTLYECSQNATGGIVCQVDKYSNLPLSVVLIAYFVSELVILIIGGILVILFGDENKSVRTMRKPLIGIFLGGLLVCGIFVVRLVREEITQEPNKQETMNQKTGVYQIPGVNETLSCPNQPNHIEPDFVPILAYILSKSNLEGGKIKNAIDTDKAEYQLITDYTMKCINIVYDKELTARHGAEGLFYFSNGTIYVSPEYNARDMLPAALLLVHEMTHAITAVSPNSPYKSCIESEVGAYISQYHFLLILSDEDRNYLIQRILLNSLGYPDSPMILTLKLVMDEIIQTTKREGFASDWDTRAKQQLQAVRNYIVASPYYQKQCDL
jgi:hypothetical protein